MSEKPKLKSVDLAILQELKKKKHDTLMQLGSLKEMEVQYIESLKDINGKLNEKDREIRKEHNIPDDMYWQINPETQEVDVISPSDLLQNMNQ